MDYKFLYKFLLEIFFRKFMEAKNIENIEQLIEFLGGDLKVAAMLDVHQTTVAYWIRTGSIPRWYWTKIIVDSAGKITADVLLRACEKQNAVA